MFIYDLAKQKLINLDSADTVSVELYTNKPTELYSRTYQVVVTMHSGQKFTIGPVYTKCLDAVNLLELICKRLDGGITSVLRI